MKATLTLICSLFSFILFAQESPVSAGSSTSSATGSISYSIGQVFAQGISGSSGSVNPGVQQTYQVSVLTSSEKAMGEGTTYSFYPNPTSNFITLETASLPNTLNWAKLYDKNGRLIQVMELTSSHEELDLSFLPAAEYYMHISDGEETQTILKIIKN